MHTRCSFSIGTASNTGGWRTTPSLRPWIDPWLPVATYCCHAPARKNRAFTDTPAHCSSCFQSPTQPFLSCLIARSRCSLAKGQAATTRR